jgi:Raf kinase inhibitor-like YbhB/YbcL family protein
MQARRIAARNVTLELAIGGAELGTAVELTMALVVTTAAFADEHKIPDRFSRDGGNLSPQLEWRGEPPETRSFALVVEDPDAPKGTFRHWAAYNIPAGTHRLPEGAGSPGGDSAIAITMAKNDFGNACYDGPQPPRGHGTHHYHFRVFALGIDRLEVSEGCDAEEVLEAARAQALAEGDAIGVFER